MPAAPQLRSRASSRSSPNFHKPSSINRSLVVGQLKGTGFSVKGTGFSVKGTGFSVKGTGFSPYINEGK